MKLRPIRPNIYLPVVRFGVADGRHPVHNRQLVPDSCEAAAIALSQADVFQRHRLGPVVGATDEAHATQGYNRRRELLSRQLTVHVAPEVSSWPRSPGPLAS